MSNERWNINRVGTAARVTTAPGEVPEYGLALDLGVGTQPYMTQEQYQAMMRELGTMTAHRVMSSDPRYQLELQRAQNYQNVGFGMPNEEFLNTDEDAGFFDQVMTGVNLFKSAASAVGSEALADSGQAARMIPVVGGWLGTAGVGGVDEEDKSAATFEKYQLLGGILSRDDFESFDETTRVYLIRRAEATGKLQSIAQVPGVSHTLTGFEQGIRGVQTAFNMVGEHGLITGEGLLGVDPAWFKKGEWYDAWRESQDQSLGNAIVNSVLRPFVSEERLDEWKRDSGLYQLSSLGAEVALGWYADPGVIIGKAAGTSARFARREMPIAETGKFYRATAQALRREQITVGGVAGVAGRLQAARMRRGWEHLDDFANRPDTSFNDFSNLRMFRHRDGDGYAAAAAMYWAFRNGKDVNLAEFVKRGEDGDGLALNYPDVKSLTQQLVVGDPKAWQDFNRLKLSATEEINKYAPGAQTFVDAMEALKTKIPTLEKEMADLDRIGTRSPFHEWSVHTEIEQRYRDIEEVKGILSKYEGYATWLDRMNQAPTIEQISARQGFFMDNQFGKTHFVSKITRPIWIKKANTAEMHDIDSGAMSIRRIFEQLDHRMKYQNPEALDNFLNRWVRASTSHERYEVMREVEERVVIEAAARKYGVSPETIRAVYQKIVAEQNRVLQGIRRGDKSIYSTAPTLGERVADEDGVSLVSHDPETGMVTLELMDHGVHHTVTVPESALAHRGPVDPTQKPNYYNPIDIRRFDIALRQNKSVLEDFDRGFRTSGELDVFNKQTFVDFVGTKFNAFWKPAVLFRFGWPMRVLMDENMRALSVLGAGAFARHFIPAYGKAMNNAAVRTGEAARHTLNLALDSPALYRFTGRKHMNIGPGPMAKPLSYTVDPVEYDRIKTDSPVVPESFAPVLDNDRYERVAAIAGDWDIFERKTAKFQAWDRELRENQNFPPENATPIQQKAFQQFGEDPERVFGTYARAPEHPMDNILRPGPVGVHVYDPITARKEASGWVVPLPHTRLDSKVDGNRKGWYGKHRELLGSRGHRIMVDSDGNYFVARVFPNRQAKKAREYAEFAEANEVWRLRNQDPKSHTRFVLKEANDLTPTLEAAMREFESEPEFQMIQGEAPIEGPARLKTDKTLMHGSISGLPDELVSRELAPYARGHMVGEGFYTTADMTVIEGYAEGNPAAMYALVGSRDGRKYRVFDMDKVPSQAELNRLMRWVERNGSEHDIQTFRTLLDRASRQEIYRPYEYEGPHIWLDYMAQLEQRNSAQRLLTRYLEEQHGAGALTHKGGQVGGRRHQVYVWLDPENLLVKPLYERTGRYVPLERFVSQDRSLVPIPENRIIRKGMRNPIFRELHTLHRQIEAKRDELRGKGKGPAVDPDYRQMLVREQEMMEALGLEYTENIGRVSRDGVTIAEGTPNPTRGEDWYVMTDPEKFNRTVSEAQAENAAFDEATRVGGQLRAQEVAVENPDFDFDDFDMDIDSIHSAFLRKVWKRRQSGYGRVAWESADGERVEYDSAFEGHQGELMRSLVSSQGAMEALSDGHGAATSLFRRQAQGMKSYAPVALTERARTRGTPENRQALEYFRQWGDLLNSQIAHSPVWNKMLQGWSDEKIVRWLNSTDEGARVMREMKHEYSDAELWVNEHRAKLDYYLPSRKLQRLLARGRLDMSQLRKEIPEEDFPTVFGPDVEFLDKRSATGRFMGWLADRIWYGLGTLPIDTLSRHPFANAVYDQKMRSLIGSTDSKWLDEATIARYQKIAHRHTREQVRRTLWDLIDETNFTDALRFIAPFWGAQSEAIVKWARIVSDRPETIARAFMLNEAVYQNFFTVDEQGNPVERNRFDWQPTDRVIIKLPNSLRKGALGKALLTIGEVGIPLGSANTVLQGETPFLPGPGPILTIPADKFMRATSDIYGSQYNENYFYRWLFPIGRPQHGGIRGMLDQVAPGWGKRVMQMADTDGVAYANLQTEVARELELMNREKGLPPPTPEQIENQARWVWGLRILAGLVSPVQTQFRSRHQFFVDEAHRYQREYGPDWFDRFVKEYGQAMAKYAVSSTNSVIGIPPTTAGMEEWSRNKKLIAQYPEWGQAIVSPDAFDDEFNADAYYAQTQIKVSPTDDRPLRESLSQKERFDIGDARTGWFEFRQVDAILDAQLQERGLHSLQQAGAEDLALIKRNFVEDLTQRNPAWRAEYDNFQNDIYTRVSELESWAFRPEFDSRPDIQGVRQYLMLRQQVAAELDRYSAETGGSRSLQAQENAALRDWFYQQVGALAQANPAFAEFYSRYLTQDTLEQGSGGF